MDGDSCPMRPTLPIAVERPRHQPALNEMGVKQCVWAICLLLSLSLISFAQSPAVTNSASQQLKNWLAAYDGHWQAYLAFVRKSFVTGPEPMFRSSALREIREVSISKTSKLRLPSRPPRLSRNAIRTRWREWLSRWNQPNHAAFSSCTLRGSLRRI